MKYTTVEETLAGLPRQFNKEHAKGAAARYQFAVGEGHRFSIAVADQDFALRLGDIESPSVVVTSDEPTWIGLCNREVGGVTAAITGRLKVQGSLATADRLIKMFGLKF